MTGKEFYDGLKVHFKIDKAPNRFLDAHYAAIMGEPMLDLTALDKWIMSEEGGGPYDEDRFSMEEVIAERFSSAAAAWCRRMLGMDKEAGI